MKLSKNDERFYTLFASDFIIKYSNLLITKDYHNGILKKQDLDSKSGEEYIGFAQEELLEKETINKIMIRIFELDKKPEFIYETVNSDKLIKYQEHIPLLTLSDEKSIKFIDEIKMSFVMTKQSMKNVSDNVDYLLENINDFEKFSSEIFNRRFKKLKERCKLNGYPEPNKKIFEEVFFESFNNGGDGKLNSKFVCYYCGETLRFKGEQLKKKEVCYKDLFTFEHRKPLSKGGTNDKKNIVLSCMSCNAIKDDMEEETFISLIKSITPELKYKLFEEKFKSQTRISINFSHMKDKLNVLEKANADLKIKNAQLTNTNKQLLQKIR